MSSLAPKHSSAISSVGGRPDSQHAGLKHIPSGQELEIGFADEDLHFFDREGRRIEAPR